jgi:hypothetical protein
MAGSSRMMEGLAELGPKVVKSIRGALGNEAAAAEAKALLPVAKEPGIIGKAAGWAGWGISRPIVWPFQAGFWVVKRPFVWADKLGGRLLQGYGNLWVRSPGTAALVTGGTAVIGGGYAVHQHNEKKAGQQAMFNPYRLAPGEFDAMVAPQLRTSDTMGGGHADAVKAAREAAVQGATPPQQ